jgi:hypothetical protein
MTKMLATLLFIAWMYAALTANWTAVGTLTVMIFIVETKGK